MPSTGGTLTTGGSPGAGGIVNPPPPPQTTCPDAMPAANTYCNYEGPSCGYGPLCGTSPTQSASCVNHTWITSASSCNPPAPVTTTCPVQAPASGSYCNYSGPACQYLGCTGSPCMCVRDATCVGYQWAVQAYDDCVVPPVDGGTPMPPDGGGTPGVLPDCVNPVAMGTPCSEPSAHCGGPCSNAWQTENVCTNGTWTLAGIVACGPNASNPPQCWNMFNNGTTPCCPGGSLDCTGKPDGYPGFGCTPSFNSYCSCTCFGGGAQCGC